MNMAKGRFAAIGVWSLKDSVGHPAGRLEEDEPAMIYEAHSQNLKPKQQLELEKILLPTHGGNSLQAESHIPMDRSGAELSVAGRTGLLDSGFKPAVVVHYIKSTSSHSTLSPAKLVRCKE